MTRSEGRTLAFELLYSLEIQKIEKEEQQEQIEMFLQENEIQEKKVKTYVQETIQGVIEKEETILKLISENLKEKWEIGRISKINLALLKLGIYEIIEVQLPYKVVVNEVVELAKKYGDDTSASFINGVLANIIKQEGFNKE